MQRLILTLFFTLALLSTSGCAMRDTPENLTAQANQEATQGGFTYQLTATDPFLITSWLKHSNMQDASLHIYIEGDGKSWISRYELAMNPTPLHPMGLALALLDPAPNVLYIARPCQFSPPAQDQACMPPSGSRYWSSARMAPEVIASMQQVINQAVSQTHAKHLHLFGYSGGGGVAVLVAASRNDVASLRTIAGNVDIALHAQIHAVTPLTLSLNPADSAKRLQHVPQSHFVGEEDTNVPAAIAQSYKDHAGANASIRIISVPGATHTEGWQSKWPSLLQMPVS